MANPFSISATNQPNLYGPVVLLYTATDGFGSSATVQRAVFVNASCGSDEWLCPGVLPVQCSQSGACLTTAAAALLGVHSSSGSAEATQSSYQPPVDTAPPVITLLGEPPAHQRAVSPSTGNAIVITSHTAGVPYEDPGATAHDFVDGDLTDALAANGLKAAMAAALSGTPTRASAPLLIRYTVSDAAGNAAVPAVRRVQLRCPDGSRLCEDDGGAGEAYCTGLGICLGADLQGSTATALSFEAAAVQLLGPAVVFVEQGQPYAKCPVPTPVDVICDKGAQVCPPWLWCMPVFADVQERQCQKASYVCAVVSASSDPVLR